MCSLHSRFCSVHGEGDLWMCGSRCLWHALCHLSVYISWQEVLVFNSTGGCRHFFWVYPSYAFGGPPIQTLNFSISFMFQELERELTFQDGSGLYYYYYKHMLAAQSFERGSVDCLLFLTRVCLSLCKRRSHIDRRVFCHGGIFRFAQSDPWQQDDIRSDHQRCAAPVSLSRAHYKFHIQSHKQSGETFTFVWSASERTTLCNTRMNFLPSSLSFIQALLMFIFLFRM